MLPPSTALALGALLIAATTKAVTLHNIDSTSQTSVRTPTGLYIGQINSTFPNVREFLGIPYGLDPSGENRWLPPRPVQHSNETVRATAFPRLCPQYVSKSTNVFKEYLPQYLASWGNDNFTAGEVAKFVSEDCLQLSIWTPADATSDSRLPVAFFVPGGGFTSGGILVPVQLPPGWVSQTQSHVVVTISYRLDILGFPNAGALEEKNVGLLDIRLALEWVRDNIAYFGGEFLSPLSPVEA